MKSTKYQLLKADFDLALRDIRLRNELIGQQRTQIDKYEKTLRFIKEKLNKGGPGARSQISKAVNEVLEGDENERAFGVR